jgi:hypothetical protein
MNTQTVVDQLTCMLAERRQQTRGRRTAHQALASAIVSEGPAEQFLLYAMNHLQPIPLGDRRGFAA